jgi:hypothetical protein
MKYTNNHNVPIEVIRAVQNDPYTKGEGVTLSVTQLIKSPRIVALQERHDDEITVDYRDEVFKLLGKAVHLALEDANAKDENLIPERRLYAEINGWRISGQTDTMSLAEKMLTDYKCTSVYAVTSDKPEWEQQLNLYTWLWRKHGYEVEKLRIMAILRDWRRSEADKKFDYPQSPVVCLDIPLWGFIRQTNFIEHRVRLHQEAMDEKAELPECTDEDRWLRGKKNIRCEGNWCQVAQFCSQWQSIKEEKA